MKTIHAALLAALLCSNGVRASSLPTASEAQQSHATTKSLTEDIVALRNRWIEAEEKKDLPFLTDLISDDCVIGNSQGQVLTKPEILARMRDQNRILHVTNTRNIRVRLYNEVVVMSEEVTINGNDHGKPFGGEFRFIRIFHREDGRWRVVLAQGTPMAKQ